MPGPSFTARAARLIAAALLIGAASACARYKQDTPDSVIASAKEMVKAGRANRLPDLIYAENKDMRDILDKLGDVLGTLQDLGRDVQKQFPDEIADLERQAEESAKKGEASNFIQKMSGQVISGGRRNRKFPDPQQNQEMSDGMNSLFKQLFSDPYGWLAESESRLTVTRANMPDDMAALLWDGKPALGVGLTLKQDGGKWYVQLPIPAGALPKSPETWEIIGDGLDVIDNMLADLRKDVRAGHIAHLNDLANKAGEKAFVPAALCLLAYEKARQSEHKQQATTKAAATSAATSSTASK